MKMVAAAKLKGFQTRMVEARPLGNQINFLVSQIPPPVDEVPPPPSPGPPRPCRAPGARNRRLRVFGRTADGVVTWH